MGCAENGPDLAAASDVEPPSVFILRFEDKAALERAFALVSDARSIASCMVEPEELRIRFLTSDKAGAPLLEQVYEHGGLVWCKRYPLRGEPASG